MRELPKHYSSREEVMREAEKYNKDEVETEENRCNSYGRTYNKCYGTNGQG